jgi:type III secretion protein Q
MGTQMRFTGGTRLELVSPMHTQARPRATLHKLARLAGRKLSRLHVALSKRPSLAPAWAALAAPVSERLSARLGAPFPISVAWLDALVPDTSALRTHAAVAVLALDAVGDVALLELPPEAVTAWVDRLAGGPGERGVPAPPTEAELAGLQLLLLDALRALVPTSLEVLLRPRLLLVTASAHAVAARVDLKQRWVGLALALGEGEARADARLLVTQSTAWSLLEAISPQSGPVPASMAQASLAMRLSLGPTRLPAFDWGDIAPGDVLLFEGSRWADGRPTGPARLRSPSFCLGGTLTPDGFSLPQVPKEKPMSEKTEVFRPALLPVDVEVELVRFKLPLGELQSLVPGSVFGLKIQVGEPVTLRVGDTAVAMAELVDIDGEVGARVLRLIK